MDHKFNLDNCIHSMIASKNYWAKFDESGVLPKTYVRQISKSLENLYSSANLYSIATVTQRVEQIYVYRKQLRALLQLPKVEQRTPEWYALRETRITASDFGDALGIEKFGKKGDVKSFYEKKCGFKKVTYDEKNVFLQWGVMFEPMATALYEHRSGIKVHEFGLIPNTKHDFLGASPDGITDLGVMLEIKCPYKRLITEDSILKQYYYQIQGQLDACDLYECDFLEVNFDCYDIEDLFWEDFENDYDTFTRTFMEKGIILKRRLTDDHNQSSPSYIYSPFNCPKTQLRQWYSQNKTDDYDSVFWNVKHFTLKRVYKDPIFVDNMNINLKTVWDKVCTYKDNPETFKKDFYLRGVSPSENTNTRSSQRARQSSTSLMSTRQDARPSQKRDIVGALFIRDDDN
jgi:putative phage-type endonuclease